MKQFTLVAVFAAFVWTPSASAHSGGELGQPAMAAGSQTDSAPSEQTDESRLQALVQKVVAKQNLTPIEQEAGPTLICRIAKREGSRIKRNRCLSAAEWKQEWEIRKLKGFRAKVSGRGRAWQPPEFP